MKTRIKNPNRGGKNPQKKNHNGQYRSGWSGGSICNRHNREKSDFKEIKNEVEE